MHSVSTKRKSFDRAAEHRMCGRKIAHASRDAAARAVRRTRGSDLHVYQCPVCRAFHVGHKRFDTR